MSPVITCASAVRMVEMASYTKLVEKTDPDRVLLTFWQLFKNAARAKYGEDIVVTKNQRSLKNASDIDFDVSILSKGHEPREATRTIIDIIIKEYTNHGKVAQDETIVRALKTSSTIEGSRYTFSTTKGVDFDFGDNIAAQVMSLSISGGVARYNKNKPGTEISSREEYMFSYDHKEKISVAPGKRVKVKITTYSIRYEMNYTLKFSVKRSASIPVSYRTKCQQLCFGCLCTCGSNGSVLVSDMISFLPNFNKYDEDSTASFTQTGTLSWVGEGCSVEKMEESSCETLQ